MDGTPAAAPAASNATAAPAAQETSSNGARGQQTPVPAPKPKPNAQQAKPDAKPDAKGVRGPDGKFVTADSGTARPPKQTGDGEGETEAQKEAYRFKRKLKVNGKDEEVDLDEEGLAREVSVARAFRAKLGELNKAQKELAEERAKFEEYRKNPRAFLDEQGASAEEMAAQLLAQKAQRGLMSPEEQRMAELEEKLKASEGRWQKHEEEQRTQQQQALEAKQWEQEEPVYLAEMERVKMPRNMATLGFMAKVGAELTEILGPAGATPQIVVAETHERLSKFAEHYVFGLSPEALSERLGPERKKALQKHWLDQWRATQTAADPVPRVEAKPPPPEPNNKPREYLSEAEVRRRAENLYK